MKNDLALLFPFNNNPLRDKGSDDFLCGNER